MAEDREPGDSEVDEFSQACNRVYSLMHRNRSSLTPDYFIKSTDTWLVFPHEIQGLSREEILANKPVDASFFELE